ncbi:unnamed protein product [Effrenium voratum]|nr:unnamed protein product [Effrenium voratum]
MDQIEHQLRELAGRQVAQVQEQAVTQQTQISGIHTAMEEQSVKVQSMFDMQMQKLEELLAKRQRLGPGEVEPEYLGSSVAVVEEVRADEGMIVLDKPLHLDAQRWKQERWEVVEGWLRQQLPQGAVRGEYRALRNVPVAALHNAMGPVVVQRVAAKPVRSGALMQQVVSNVLLTGPPVSAFLHSALARSWFKGKKVHYDSVLKYLQRRNLAAHPDELIYITGHSLGGGIANLLGAELGIPSIAFSPPGVQSTATLLEINPARLQAMALDIIPDQDPVSRAAGPHGTVQLPIGCADKGAQCHRIFNSVCELFDMCGDQATPRRKLPCDFCPAKIQQRHSLAPHCARHGEPLEPPPVIL